MEWPNASCVRCIETGSHRHHTTARTPLLLDDGVVIDQFQLEVHQAGLNPTHLEGTGCIGSSRSVLRS